MDFDKEAFEGMDVLAGKRKLVRTKTGYRTVKVSPKRKRSARSARGRAVGNVGEFVVVARLTRTRVHRDKTGLREEPFTRDFSRSFDTVNEAAKYALSFMEKHPPMVRRDQVMLYLIRDLQPPAILLEVEATQRVGEPWKWNIDRSYIDGIRATPRRLPTGEYVARREDARRAVAARFHHDEALDEMKTIPMTGMSQHGLAKGARKRAKKSTEGKRRAV